MLEKIQMMMSEKGLKPADVARGANIPYTTFDSLFKKGFENTRYPTIRKLSKFFDVSMDYLIDDDVNDRNYGKIYPVNITQEENQLIDLWRKLPHDEQMKLLGRIESKVEEYIKGEYKLGDD